MTIEKKREIIRKLDDGVSVSSVMSEYKLPKSTLYDLRKAAVSVKLFHENFGKETKHKKERKTMRKPSFASVDEATFKWWKQQRLAGVMVRGVEVMAAAKKFADLQGLTDFTASNGWLARFKQRHGLSNKISHGESLDADETGVDEFRNELTRLVSSANLSNSQLYNADETGLFWLSTPTNTLANEEEKKVAGHKKSKQRITALCCANATGSHRLKPVVVGKAKNPRPLRGMMNRLPVIYLHSKKAWFTQELFKQWYFENFVPEVIRYQTEDLKIPHDEVKALLLLDNAPAHPSDKSLVAHNGRIRVLYLPANTTSIIQPMDQGVIVSAKRMYRKRFLNEVMVVLEEEEDIEQGDTRGQRTLQNIKNYNMKSCVFNWAGAWRDVPVKTLENAWNPLLRGTELFSNFEGFDRSDVIDIHARFVGVGDREVTQDDVREWLDDDGGDPGHHLMSDREIADSSPGYVVKDADADPASSDSDADDTDVTEPLPKLRQLREATDVILTYLEHPDANQRLVKNRLCDNVRQLHEEVIRCQNTMSFRQASLDTFFRSPTPSVASPPLSRTSSLGSPLPRPPQITSSDEATAGDVSLPSPGPSYYQSSPTPEPTARPLRRLWVHSSDSDSD